MTFAVNQKRDQRKFQRIPFDAYAYVSYKGRTYRANLEDLSTRATRLTTDALVPVGEVAEVVIVRDGIKVTLFAKVARATMTGLVFADMKSTESKLGRLFFSNN